jgi:hypothetical protein
MNRGINLFWFTLIKLTTDFKETQKNEWVLECALKLRKPQVSPLPCLLMHLALEGKNQLVTVRFLVVLS